MFCKNCGKELPDGVKFCNACGAPVTPPPEAGGPAPDSGFIPTPGPTMGPAAGPDSGFVPTPGPTMGPAAGPDGGFVPGPGPAQPGNYPGAETAVKASPAAGLAAKLKGNKTGLIILGVGAVAVIAVIVLLVNVIGGLLGGGGSKPLYAYLNDDYELMYLPGLSQDAESVEISDKTGFSTGVQFAPDGKTLYFTDADNSLYKIAVAGLTKEGGKPERIKKDVSMFRVLQDGRILFREYDSGKLSVYDGEETFTLVKEYDSYQLSEDHKTLYYTELDDDGTRTLYRIAIDKDAGKEKLLDGADTIYTSWDAETLVYGEGGYTYGASQDEGDRNTLAVYACKPGEKAEKLIDDIYSVTGVQVDGDKVSFHYWVQNVDQRTLYDFVTDNNASSDAAILAERPTSPSSWDYSPASHPDGLYIENGVIYCRDNKGDAFPVDTSDLQAQQGLPPEELSYWDVLPIAQTECNARYEQAREEYDTAYQAWQAANSRESLRSSLQSSEYTQTSYELYHFDGAKPQEPIADDIFSTNSHLGAGIFLYKKANTAGGTVGDVADLDGYYDVYTRLEEGSNDDDWYQNVGGKESVLDELDTGDKIFNSWILNGTELILQVSEGDDESGLQSFAIGADALTFNSLIVDDGDDFSDIQLGTDSAGKDALYLFTEVSEDSRSGQSTGDFCVYREGKLETISKEVYGVIVLDESRTTYVITDIDRESNLELALLKDGELTSIIDEMSDNGCIFVDSTQILYTSDDDLYLWNGKESVRIARDVLRVWASAQESYSTYAP